MNLVNVLLDKSELPENGLSSGGILGLWNSSVRKINFAPVYLVFYKQAVGTDVKNIVYRRINVVRSQVQDIRGLLNKRGFQAPQEPDWEKKMKDDSGFVLSRAILEDKEILLNLREHLKTSFSIETETLRDSTIPEIRDLIFKIIKDDNRFYGEILELIKEKGWSDAPPYVKQQ